ncbi:MULTISPECIES: hypothetical protein [unclassified Lactobacillus]|uniref:hypothetical protein n=1 Tax=unclassified Lactobacillus TaxID=2620435 RepID=UPI0018F4E6BE|nr:MULTISPECIES: hypothetical protein [unclassified Lactobacillus]
MCGHDEQGYHQTEKKWPKHRYTEWLADKYGIIIPDCLFDRCLVVSFVFIIKSDVSEYEPPLYGIKGDNMQKSLDRLVTLFDRYKDIEVYKEKLSAYKAARKYRFVSDLAGGDKQYEANVQKINSLQVEFR